LFEQRPILVGSGRNLGEWILDTTTLRYVDVASNGVRQRVQSVGARCALGSEVVFKRLSYPVAVLSD
jgi:hypothetical protein